MGFVYGEYKDDWNNASGLFGGKIKEKLGIGDGKVFGILVNPTKNAEYEANKYVTSGQAAIDTKKAEDERKALDVIEEARVKADIKRKQDEAKKIADEEAKKIAEDESKKIDEKTKKDIVNSKKNKTMLYVGIGAGVLVLGTIITIIIIKRNK